MFYKNGFGIRYPTKVEKLLNKDLLKIPNMITIKTYKKEKS